MITEGVMIMSHRTPVAERQQTILLRTLEEELRQRQAEVGGRRSMTRYAFNAPVSISVVAADGSEQAMGEAWALDFSRRGIGLLAERVFAVGDILAVDFGRRNDRETFSARMRVAYCTRLLSSTFRIGGEFIP
jgi:hypothetical protein